MQTIACKASRDAYYSATAKGILLKLISDFRRHEAFAPLKAFLSSKPVLFHGSRYGNAIIESGCLLAPTLGDRCVSFSRNPAVALYMASLERDFDEGQGTVFVIDRTALSARYRLRSRCNGFEYREEAEEAVWQDIRLFKGLIIGQVFI
jgi:hypothetical protein